MKNRKNTIFGKDDIPSKELSSIKQELHDWRLLEKRPHRIPEEFWLRAARLAAYFSINKISRELNIDFNKLKRYVGLNVVRPLKDDKPSNISADTNSRSLKNNFIELQFSQFAAPSLPIAEITSNKGNNLKIFTADCNLVSKLMESFLSL